MTDKQNIPPGITYIIGVTLDDVFSTPDSYELSSTMSVIQRKYRLFVIFIVSLTVGSILYLLGMSLPLPEKIIGYNTNDDTTILISNRKIYSYDNEGILKWSTRKAGDNELRYIRSFNMDENGNIYTLSPRAKKNDGYLILDKFNSSGEWIATISISDEKENYSFLLLRDGNILIQNSKNNMIYLYTPEGRLLTGAEFKIGDNDSWRTIPITQLPDGRILLVDPNKFVVYEMSEDLKSNKILTHIDEPASSFYPSDIIVDEKREKAYIIVTSNRENRNGYIVSLDINTGEPEKNIYLTYKDGSRANPSSIWNNGDGGFSIFDENNGIPSDWNPDYDVITQPTNKAVIKFQSDVSSKARSKKVRSYIFGFTALFGFIVIVIFLVVTEKMARKLLARENQGEVEAKLRNIFYDPTHEKETGETTQKSKETSKNVFRWLLFSLLTLSVLFSFLVLFLQDNYFFFILFTFIIAVFALLVPLLLSISKEPLKNTFLSESHLFRYRNDMVSVISKNEIVIDAIAVKPPKISEFKLARLRPSESMLLMTDKNIYKFDHKLKTTSLFNSTPNIHKPSPYPIKISYIRNVEISKRKFNSFPQITFTLSSGQKVSEETETETPSQKFAERIAYLQKILKAHNTE